MSDAASRRALRLAVRPDAAAFAAWAPAHAGAVDWPWVVHTATAHKLLALVAARLAASGLDVGLDPDLRRRLFLARIDAGRCAAAAAATLAAVGAAFDAAEVPFFVVKGSVLSHEVYGDPLLRRFADVDAVVRHADVSRAEAVLRAHGYRPGGAEGLLATRPAEGAEQARAMALTRGFDRRHLAAHTWYAPPDRGLRSIDLHWHVSPARLRVREAALWEQVQAVDLAGTTIRTLAPPAMVIHLAAHATTCLLAGFRLLHLVDVAWAATRFADHAAATWQLAAQWRVGPHLAQVLALAARYLELDPLLPDGAPPPARAWAGALAREPLLLDAPALRQRPAAARLRRELEWGVAMGCLRRNVPLATAAALARARFRAFRRRAAAAAS